MSDPTGTPDPDAPRDPAREAPRDGARPTPSAGPGPDASPRPRPQTAMPRFVRDRARPLRDPAVWMLGVGGVVLLGALGWLWSSPRPPGVDGASEPDRLAAVEAQAGRLPELERRLTQLDGVRGRIEAAEPRLRALEIRPEIPDLRQPLADLAQRQQTGEGRTAAIEQRATAAEQRLQDLAARPVADPAQLAPRPALDALAARVAETQGQQAQRLDEMARAATERAAAAERAVQERLAAAAKVAEERVAGLERDATQRAERLEKAAGDRTGQLERTVTERLGALEKSAGDRSGEIERRLTARLEEAGKAAGERVEKAEAALAARLAKLEQAQARLDAVEARAARLAGVDQLQSALAAGQPLGRALSGLREPPEALARFAAAAPPTEASLRLSFEEAARAARAAADPGRQGTGVMDSAVQRLSGLVTVRRGEDVVWGDAASAEIERARRALEAGDVEAALAQLGRLPPASQEAMKEWTGQARALLAARAALRQMAQG